MRSIELDCGDVRRTRTDGGRRGWGWRSAPTQRLHQSKVGVAEPIDLAGWEGTEECVGTYIGSPIAEVASRELAIVEGCEIGRSAIERKICRVAGASLMKSRSRETVEIHDPVLA